MTTMTTATTTCPHCEGEGIVRNWSLGVDQIDDHRSCPDCLGAGEVPDPVAEANRALVALQCGGTLSPSAASRILRSLVAEVESLRRHNGPENNDE
jgi:DnaJ-class molecular chaperone